MAKEPLLSSGLYLLNLACSGTTKGFIRKGQFFFFIGDSSTGKSWLAMQIAAEICLDPEYDDYEIHYNDAENGALADIDIEKFFGKKLAKRIKVHRFSTVEQLYDFLNDLYKAGKKFLMINDSMDSLECEADIEKFEEQKNARKKGKQVAGTYGTEKARINSRNLRRIANKELPKTGSIFINISQTRDNIRFGFAEKTRSGGKALDFYSHLSIWTSKEKPIKQNVNGKDRSIGGNIKFKITKNRVSGRYATIIIPFFFHYGFDNILSCINFLLDEKHWKKTAGKVVMKEFNKAISLKAAAAWIEKTNNEDQLKKIVKKVWMGIEEQMRTTKDRKTRYK